MNKNQYISWLDNIRNPFQGKWSALALSLSKKYNTCGILWVKNYIEFANAICIYGMPGLICFDNDLGENKEGYDCAKWLIDYCLDNDIDAPNYYIQSDNGPAQDNIKKLIDNYKKFYCTNTNNKK